VSTQNGLTEDQRQILNPTPASVGHGIWLLEGVFELSRFLRIGDAVIRKRAIVAVSLDDRSVTFVLSNREWIKNNYESREVASKAFDEYSRKLRQ